MPRYAAIDIGSNSIRMIAAETGQGPIRTLADERQVTRLGESVFRTGRISEEAMEFVLATLGRMAAIYQKLPVDRIRAVATSAVRDASNQDEFIERASAILRVGVEIISGPEEARLIHLGVESRWPRRKENTLIIDVGGGSAELILGQGGKLIDAVSRPLGAVRLTEVFLKSDPPTADELHRMTQYIDEKLSSFAKRHGNEKFDRAVATSASAAAIVCAVNEVPRPRREEANQMRASVSQIRNLYSQLVTRDVAGRRKIPGIGPRRAEIVIAGAAVFLRVLERLHHQSLYYSAAGVRDGIIADFEARGVGRELSQLSTEQRKMVEAMAKRYGVSLKHVQKVAQMALRIFEVTQPIHNLSPAAGKFLHAAAYLHDVGHWVSDTGHHKHSEYLVANSDMPGFTNRERMTIASLCRFHRKSMPQPRHATFQGLDADARRTVLMLSPLLRLADSLDRGHRQRVHDLKGQIKNGGVVIQLKADKDADLETWAANQAAATFQQVYGIPLSIQRSR